MVETEQRPSALAGAAAVLAAAMLMVELLAGIQSYLSSTTTPLMAAELHAQGWYGLLTAGVEAATFLTMPLGVALLARWSGATLLTALTPVMVLGAVVSATAPGPGLFMLGRVIAALAAGALMTVSLGAMVRSLPPSWRRRVLAGYAAVWVVASLVGPAYAAWVAHTWGWRWALVGYLPLFLLARSVVISRLRVLERLPSDDPSAAPPARPLVPALALAGGIGAMGLAAAGAQVQWWRLAVGLVAVVSVVVGAGRLLPRGTLSARPGRPAGVATLGMLCAAYFGAGVTVPIIAHDVLGRDAGDLGLVLSVGGLGWAVTGLVCGRWAASGPGGYRRRLATGALLIVLGYLLMAAALVAPALAATPVSAQAEGWRWAGFVAGWGLAGVGMGMSYLDTLDAMLTEPSSPDGLGSTQMAGAAVMTETIGTAVATTVTGSVMAWVVVGGAGLSGRAPGMSADPSGPTAVTLDAGAAAGSAALLAGLALVAALLWWLGPRAAR